MDSLGLLLRNRRILLILGGVLVVVFAGVAYFMAGRPDRLTDSLNATSNSSNQSAPPHLFDTRNGVAPPDADHDGLTDAEESTLSTNPTLADTDRDGLTDFDEVKLYRSDPKKADSDGDGRSDGEEVKHGFSPTGSGKLFDTSTAASKNATP